MAVAIWMIRRTEYFGGRVGAVRADPELADVLVKRGDAQLIQRGVKLQKIDRSAPAPQSPEPQPDDEKATGGKKGRKARAAPADDATKADATSGNPPTDESAKPEAEPDPAPAPAPESTDDD